MTMTLPEVPMPRKTPARTAPRPPSLTAAERTVRAIWLKPTEDGLTTARRKLVRAMWRARRAGLRTRYTQLRTMYRQVCAAQAARDWESPAPELAPRARTGRPAEQASALLARTQITTRTYPALRAQLLALTAAARPDRQEHRRALNVLRRARTAYAEHVAREAAASMRLKRAPTGQDPITRDLAHTWGVALSQGLPLTKGVAVDAVPRQDRTAAAQYQLRATSHQRHAANALAQALWAVQQGNRDWESIPTRSTLLQASAPTGGASSGITGPARLIVDVPASSFGPAGTLTLYRADYDRLTAAWGINRARTAKAQADQLRGLGVPDLLAQESARLTLDAATHPNLAHAWYAYISSPRLGDIYALHSSLTMQLAPRRSGDLREALERIMVLAEFRQVPDTPHAVRD